jgi:serine/threonine-protein kinase
MYELLTGRPPFTGDSPVAIAYQHVRENPIPPSRIDPEIPQWADAIVLKAMEKAPADRYQSAAEMRTDIQRALSGMPIAAAPPTRMDFYPTQRMGAEGYGAGATTAIPPFDDYVDEDYEPRRRGRGRGALPWILGLMVVIGAIAAVAYMMLGGGKTYSVPSVANIPVAQAQTDITNAGLRSTVVNQPSSTVTKGNVISSNPQFGTDVPKGSNVVLTVSTGAQQVQVPNVVGDTQTAAENQLKSAGLTFNVQTDAASTAAPGTVDHTSPTAGTMVAPNSAVTLYVSGATAVPSVVGMSQADATALLQQNGFRVAVLTGTATTGNFQAGTVYQQVPGAKTTEPSGSTVTIYVAQNATPTPTQSSGFGGSASASPTGGLGQGGGGGGGNL